MVDEALVQALFWIGLAMWGIGHRLVEQHVRRGRETKVPLLRRDFK